jgi:hypothetical protein
MTEAPHDRLRRRVAIATGFAALATVSGALAAVLSAPILARVLLMAAAAVWLVVLLTARFIYSQSRGSHDRDTRRYSDAQIRLVFGGCVALGVGLFIGFTDTWVVGLPAALLGTGILLTARFRPR